MALKQSKQVAAGLPIVSALDAVSLVPIVAEYVVPAGGTAIGDVIEFGGLPAGLVPVDFLVHNSAGAAASTLAWGMLSGNYGSLDGARVCGNEFLAAYGVTAAAVTRLNKPLTGALQADDTKGWGCVVAGAALQAGQIIRAVLFCAPAPIGIS